MPLEHLSFCLTIWAVSWAQDLVVSQPASAEGTEGASVILHCGYSSEIKIGSYRWEKDRELNITNTTLQFRGRQSRTSDKDFISKRIADIEILDLRHYDAGMYRCIVNTHGQPEIFGNGTELRVRKPNATTTRCDTVSTNGLLVGFGTGLGSALLIFVIAALVVFLCYRKKQAESTEHQAKAPRIRRSTRDHTSDTDLNYAEVTVKKGKKPRRKSEVVTYAAVKRHEQY